MRRFSYAILILALSLLSLVSVGAQALPDHWTERRLTDLFPALPANSLEELRREGELTHFYREEVVLTLAPSAFGWDEARQRIEQFGPKLGVEALFLLPYPEELRSDPDPELSLYNVLRSVSTMEGIEYYSASRERMRIFYIDSYAIDNPDSRRREPDPIVSAIPRDEEILVYQRDSSFGRNVHRIGYTYDDGAYLLRMTNLTPMFYGILPLVAEENLDVYLTVIPVDEGIVFYGNSAVRVISLFGMEDRARNSFYNRIKALFDWFAREIG